MDFRVLGPLEVAAGGLPISLGVPKQRALLAVLLLHANEVVSRERLVDELWGEAPPARAAKLVQHYVSGLRKLLPAGVLLTRAPGYLLRVEPGQLDLGEFEALLEGARRAAAEGETARAADLYRHALSLWRGSALADVALESHAAREAAGLDDLRLATLVERVECELELGRHGELVGELEALVERHPYQERLRGQLMLALYRSGRQAEALEAYQHTRRLLLDELGLEPSQDLQRLERAILQQDASLELPEAPAPTPAATEARLPPRRKTVTIVVAALTAPSADPEAFGHALSRAFGELAAAAEYHGGRAERLAGGELMAVFGVPEAHEDDALRALRAAAQVRAALGEQLKMGAATGEVLADGFGVTGDAVGEAARFAAEAAPGEIVAAPATLGLAGSAVERDGSRVLAVADARPAFPARTEAPLVGREDELTRLRELFDSVLEARRCRVVTVFGEAGIGKTRLMRELVARVRGEALVLVGRCVSYGEGATYLPLREALRDVDLQAALADEEEGVLVAQRLAELTGEAEGAGSSGEGFWAVRRLLEALARKQPLLLVLEDVHWAETTFLDLVEYLAEWSREAPILVLSLARPELLDTRPAWGGATSPVASLVLDRLGAEDSEALVAALAGGLSARARDRIAEIAEGNPLYAEQLSAFAQDAGEAELAAVPPTIDALLASRLDRLAVDERATLERAAVVGREFPHDAVVHLSPPDAAGAVGRHLLALARRGLVRSGLATTAPGDAFRFHHVLIRDVAYNGIPKGRRAELHERHADWLDEREPDDALVGYHLEQAYRLRSEVAGRDGHAQRLAIAAGERLSTAGVRAWRTGDAPAATNLLGRAAALLPQSHGDRANVLRELGWTLWAAGRGGEADVALAQAVEAAAASDNRSVELHARLNIAYRRLATDPAGRGDELLELAAEAIPVLETLGDHRTLGLAWLAVAHVHGGWQGRYALAADELERSREHYAAYGWVPPMWARELAMTLHFGSTPVDVAIERCRELLDPAGPLTTADVGIYLAGLEAMRGQIELARRLCADALAIYREIARTSLAATWAPVAAEIEQLAGDPQAAARVLEEACVILERQQDTGLLSQRAGMLAAILAAGEPTGVAERWASVAERTAASDDVGAQVWWRAARARLLAFEGEAEAAVALAREAVSLGQATDRLNERAAIVVELANVLRAVGRDTEAAVQFQTAVDLYERKGNVTAAERARALVPARAPA